MRNLNPITYIDTKLNSVTMYRLLVYGLGALIVGSIILCLTNALTLSAGGIALSTLVLVVVCYIANRCLAVLWSVPSNSESWLITALILVCIMPPTTNPHRLALIAGVGLVAMASKYIVAIHRKHLLNPAAFGALVFGVTHQISASWWIGSSSTLILTSIFGLLVLRKIRRFQLFFSFLAAALLVAMIVGTRNHLTIGYILSAAFKSSPLIFLGSIMLTEPESNPPLLWQIQVFGLIVGALFTSQIRFGSQVVTPEIALIVGNVFAYAVSPKHKLKLTLTGKHELAPGIFDFAFAADHQLKFQPGQYLEWTLHNVDFDRRGNRRTFTIASAPGTNEIHMAIKTAQFGSTYKRTLLAMKPGDTMMAGQLAGNFTLPKNLHQKLVFIAGGIGVTPFVSMAQHMIAKQQTRDVTLFYFVPNPAEFCYQDLWKQAAAYGLKVVPVLSHKEVIQASWPGKTGRLTPELLKTEAPDFADSRYYISGPNALVDAYRKLLGQAGIKQSAIVVDHFSGY